MQTPRRVFIFHFVLLTVLLSASACSSPPIATLTLPPATTEAPTQTPFIVTATGNATVVITPGLYILSLTESGTAHLFAYAPGSLPLTRLTADPWDDITPALSPDRARLAFASRRNGYWDLYLLDLQTGETTRLTDTPEYDAAPSWSPDGQWLVTESYSAENLDLYVRSVTDPAQAPIQLTNNPAADHSPAWSPQARQVAFISNRSGEEEVWFADLDIPGEERFTNISRNPQGRESHPAWSPDGNQLAWASTDVSTGLSAIYVWDSREPDSPPRWMGSGDWPVWQDENHLATRLGMPNQTYLTAFTITTEPTLPPLPLPGSLRGLVYAAAQLPTPLPAIFREAGGVTPAPLYPSALTPVTGIPIGRAALVPLDDVQAPYPELQEGVGQSFQALRQRVAVEVGWDALASLSNAYVPLTTPLDPGFGDDWLYTGRAFTLNPLLANAGWIAAVREDYGQETYWRLYLRTRAQDGSQGEPLHESPWDFNARYSGDPITYDQGGGTILPAPAGYWFDLTSLALQYGWERLPALGNWRTYYNGARFNEFAMTQGLDWRAAMLELYPPEALVTPTIVVPPTRTPTRTPYGYKTPTPSLTPTPRPTLTPGP